MDVKHIRLWEGDRLGKRGENMIMFLKLLLVIIMRCLLATCDSSGFSSLYVLTCSKGNFTSLFVPRNIIMMIMIIIQ